MDTYIVRVEYNDDSEPYYQNYIIYANTFAEAIKFIEDWEGDSSIISSINAYYYGDMPYVIDDLTYFDIMKERG